MKDRKAITQLRQDKLYKYNGNAIVIAGALILAGCGANGLPPIAKLDGANSAISQDATEGMPNAFGEPQTATAAREIIAKPTTADIMAPAPIPEMSFGRAEAPLTIVQYASMTCPHCRRFHAAVYPQLKRRFIDTGKVRYILREFPIGKTSGLATIALRCAPPEKYMELYGRFMEQQAAWVSQEVRPDAVFAIAQQVGMTRAQFDQCRENQGMIENLKWVKERGRKLGIIGTPNFFVGTKLIKGDLSIDEIAAFVEQPPTAGNTASVGAQN